MIRHLGRLLTVAGAIAVLGSLAHAAPIFTIDFETEDDFVTPLVHGQSIYSTPRPNNANPFVPYSADTRLEFGNLLTVSSAVIGNDGHLGPAIFDSEQTQMPARDEDLHVGLGNVLMLQRDEGPNTTLHPTNGLVFNNPSDEASMQDRGSLVLDFLVPWVHLMSIDVVDIDAGVNLNLILTDVAGLTRTYSVPSRWTTDVTDDPAGFQTLNLDTLMNQPAEPNATGGDATATQASGFNDRYVVRLEVQILGTSPSAAIDNLVFAIPEPASGMLSALAAACIFSRYRFWRPGDFKLIS